MILRRKYFLVSFLSQPWISARTILGSWRENEKKIAFSIPEKQSAKVRAKSSRTTWDSSAILGATVTREWHRNRSYRFGFRNPARWGIPEHCVQLKLDMKRSCVFTMPVDHDSCLFPTSKGWYRFELGFFGDRRLVFVVFWDRLVFFPSLVFFFFLSLLKVWMESLTGMG